MKPISVVIDTNVVVAALLTSDPQSPTSQILNGMLGETFRGKFVFLLSVALLAEYRSVLLRPRISALHRLSESEIDEILTQITENGIVRDPSPSLEPAPDPGDSHLWALLQTTHGALLITGDGLLLENPPSYASVLSPRTFVVEWLG